MNPLLEGVIPNPAQFSWVRDLLGTTAATPREILPSA